MTEIPFHIDAIRMEVGMRSLDPKTAPRVPVDVSLEWKSGMPNDELIAVLTYWDRAKDELGIYEGRLTGVTVRSSKVDKAAITWLKNIGARAE